MKKFAVVICSIAVMFQLLAIGRALAEGVAKAGRGSPEPVASVDGKTYYADYTEPFVSWEEAKELCNSTGMKLATFDTLSQYLAIRSSNMTSGAYWTSGRDALSVRQFVWDETKEPLAEDLPYESFWSSPFQTCVSVVRLIIPQGTATMLVSGVCTSELGTLCEL